MWQLFASLTAAAILMIGAFVVFFVLQTLAALARCSDLVCFTRPNTKTIAAMTRTA